MSGSKNRRWCFTLNNYSVAESERCAAFLVGDRCVYGVVGRETGEAGTPHLQGFLILTAPQRLSFLRSNLSDRAHYEVARGTSKEASDYCKKDGFFSEFGEVPVEQGRRTDIERFRSWVEDQGCRPSQREIAREFPSLFLRYPKLTELIDHFLPPPELQFGELNEWQREIEALLEEEPDDRTITFVVDEEGAKGKSWFVRFMITTCPETVQFLSVGKRDDLAFAIDETKSVFLFDIPRGGMEFLQYAVLEKLKDQMIFSSKYTSRVKVLPKPVHVVVFSNEAPNMDAMTADRYVIKLI